MSSYLYIIKYELPLVIQAFSGVDKPAGWVDGDGEGRSWLSDPQREMRESGVFQGLAICQKEFDRRTFSQIDRCKFEHN